jgi:rubredoxin
MTNTVSCPNCHSTKTEFDQTYGFYKCLDCLHVWAEDKDDPDYDDLDDSLEETPPPIKPTA